MIAYCSECGFEALELDELRVPVGNPAPARTQHGELVQEFLCPVEWCGDSITVVLERDGEPTAERSAA